MPIAPPLLAPLALAALPGARITLEKIGSWAHGGFGEGAAEIGAYDAGSRRLFVTNASANTLDVLDLSDPRAPAPVVSIDLSPWGAGVNSVAVHEGLVAVAVEADPKTDPGAVVFFDAAGRFKASATVGALPDMVAFTPDGRYALVANEGEPNDAYTVDPEGSISVIGTWSIAHGQPPLVRTADFHRFDGQPLDPSIRIFGPGASVSQDLEPEFIAVGPRGELAWVTCQENNAIALVHVRSARVIGLFGLGRKDHSRPGNGLDPSNRDAGIAIASWPVRGLYQPDAIAVTEFLGIPFLLTANEGDARDYAGFSEEARIEDLVLDPTVFPPALGLQADAKLGRLTTTTVGGDSDGDGDKDVLFAFGARSMSVWSPHGELLWDSGDTLEQVTAAALPQDFNSSNDENGSFDGRSDDKGPEPEGIAVGRVGWRRYAFVGLERVGGIAIFDVTLPWAPSFVDYVSSRDFAGDPEQGTAGDLGPEGVLFIPAHESPTHVPLLVVTHEISGTTAIFRVVPR